MNSVVMLALEIIGTGAFAVTGDFLSVKRHLDILHKSVKNGQLKKTPSYGRI